MSLWPRRLKFESSMSFVCDSFFLFNCKHMYDHRRRLECRLSSREVSFMYIVLLALLVMLLFVLLLLFFSFCYIDTVCGFTTEYLDPIDYNVCCYTLVAAATAACCCCSWPCARWQNLFPWFTASDSGVFFLFIWTPFPSMYPLEVLSHFQRRFF